MPQPPRRASFAALAAAGLVAHLLAVLPYIGFYPDDSYIYAQFVRQFVLHGEVAFNAGQPVYGVTSAAHFWLWALPQKLLALSDHDAVLLAGKLVTACYTLAWIAVVAALARRVAEDARLRYAVVVVLTTHVWPARWHVSGMETALADLAFAGFLLALARQRCIWASTALATLHFCRPETIVWVPLWAGFLLWLASRRGARVAASLATYVAIGAVLAGSMLWTTGAILPVTAGAKSATLGFDLAPLLRMGQLFGSACAPESLLLALLAARLLRKRAMRGEPRVVLVAVMVLALCALYELRGVSLYTRYISFLYGVPMLAGAYLVQRHAPTWRNALLAAGTLSVALNFGLSLTLVAPATRGYMDSMRRVNRPIADELRRATRPGDVIAAADIGLIGFYSDRPIFDVVGLVSPEMLAVKWDAAATRRLIEQKRPKYFVNVTAQPGTIPFPGFEGFELHRVSSYTFEKMFVFGGPMVYEVYRIEEFAADP